MKKSFRVIRIGIPVLAAGVFCLWLIRKADPLSPGAVSAFLSLCLFTLTLTEALCRLLDDRWSFDARIQKGDTPWERFIVWRRLLLFGMAVSIFQYVLVYLLVHPGTDFIHSFRLLYYRSDVAHYMGIAKNWYVPEGDERLRLVFLPLYPLTIRALSWNGTYFDGALAAAQLFSLACLPAGYELFRLDGDKEAAMGCARLLFLLPGNAFLRVPMSEGLFLFLTLLAVLYARERRFLLSALFTALAAFTRSLGILLLGLLFLEMASAFAEAYRDDGKRALRLLPGYAGCLLLCCTGTLAYLVINWRVTGDPLTFLTYQRENWNQQLGLFFNTASYQTEYMLMYLKSGDLNSVISLSLPNLICCFGTLLLLFAGRKRLRTSYLIWALAYYVAAIGATWLLSGPRYLAMLFPLAIALRRLCKGTYGRIAIEGTLLISQTCYLLLLAMDLYVY